jgi:two-component sensor histidine kinase
MHPILAARGRLTLYLAAWVLLLALLAFVSRVPGASWLPTAGVLVPACVVFAFACLSPWYICRVQPLQISEVTRLAVTWTSAAVSGGALLAGAAWLTARLSGQTPPNAGVLAGLGAILYLLSAGLHYTAVAAEASRASEQRAAEARSLARDAELQALRMQINPHFLFNSLHSIAALTTQDADRAREMCIRLSDFLRSSLGLGHRESIPLREELDLARSYLVVEQVRFGSRLKVIEEIEAGCQDCAIPPLLLQPLVENAVKHGVAGMVEGGEIRLAVTRQEEQVVVTVENPFDPDAPPPNRLGVGLTHVRRRLEVCYHGEARCEAGARDGFYRVELRFPCESPMASISRA